MNMKQAAAKQTQKEKFLAMARDVGATENQKTFDAALKRIASAKMAVPKSKAKKAS
jgi:hypothetical protein